MGQKVLEGPTLSEIADLIEYETLRHEIDSRVKISYTVITLDLAAVGSGLTIVEQTSHILAGLAIATSVLWLLWTDNEAMMHRLGAYIAIRLAPRLREVGRPALEWESFMRRLRAGGTQASAALGRPRKALPGPRHRVPTDWYLTTILGAAPPILLGFYISSSIREGGLTWLAVGVLTVLASALWVYASIHFVSVTRMIRAYGDAVMAIEREAVLSA